MYFILSNIVSRNQRASVVLSFLRQLKVSTQTWRSAKLLVLGEVCG